MPAVHSRGAILLAVDSTVIGSLSLQQFTRDLIGDGWEVLTESVPRADIPRYRPTTAEITAGFSASPEYITWKAAVATTKSTIRSAYTASGASLKSVLLIGHVAVPYAGLSSDDGHSGSSGTHGGATACDAFYGDMSADTDWTDSSTFVYSNITVSARNNNFPNDGKFDNDALPTNHKLDIAVGRVDFSLLSAYGVPLASTSPARPLATASTQEIGLLQDYVNRNHDWRDATVTADRQAAYNVDFYGIGYDGPTENRLAANVGATNLTFATWNDETGAPAATQDGSWLWGIASGSGQYAGINVHAPADADGIIIKNAVGTANVRFNASFVYGPNAGSSDASKVVFNQIFGSYVGDWDGQNSLLMSSIAQQDSLSIATMYGGRPQWEVHTMALGESFADGQRRTVQPNSGYDYNTFYTNKNEVSLLGDPTLREVFVKPVSNVQVNTVQAGAGSGFSTETTIVWTASTDTGVSGYYIYRADSAMGSYTLLNTTAVTGTSYVDTTAPATGAPYYMVRATKLEETPSGSYWNLSTGIVSRRLAETSTFVWNEPPQKLTIDFAQDVGTGLVTSDFSISGERYDVGTATFIPITFTPGTDFILESYDTSTDVATIKLLTTSETGVANTIMSGRYTVSVTRSALSEIGDSIEGTSSFSFVFVAADTNNDGVVSFDDLLVVAQNYNQTGVTGNSFGVGDFDNDGDVDFDDLLLLGQYYDLDVN
jgi:hypothetical protein